MADFKSIERIRFWYGKISEAEHALRAAIEVELTPGSFVTYQQGHNEIIAEIVELNPYMASLRVKVRGKTGREYWLDVARITGRFS